MLQLLNYSFYYTNYYY